ncbi:hypothetical protein [Hymenobacter negativus]|uniref:Uncharacterized protein n=1 Tax=Hymenobacter negativus TaxID=2795026 RepID=A0ABS0Q9U5_9BACT|nr:hypothetical protein [Hymenobacter negativus]MBH8559242.1 hypothetical protein [Hymenobacter negativus]
MQTGQKLSEEEEFYVEWMAESIKDNLAVINDITRQILTISSALLGLSVFYDKVLENAEGVKLLVILFFAASVIQCFLGLLPNSQVIDMADIEVFKEHKRMAYKTRYRLLMSAALCLLAGLTTIIVYLVIGIFK